MTDNLYPIHADLKAYVDTMCTHNGWDQTAYLNGLLERGVRNDLEETYTEDSVHRFLLAIKTSPIDSAWPTLQPRDVPTLVTPGPGATHPLDQARELVRALADEVGWHDTALVAARYLIECGGRESLEAYLEEVQGLDDDEDDAT